MAAASPELTLWRQAPGYSSQRSAEEQLAFARALDAAAGACRKGRAIQTDFDDDMEVPDDVVTGLPETFPSLESFWRACLEPRGRAGAPSGSAGSGAADGGADAEDGAERRPSTETWYRHSTWFWTRKAMTADDSGVLGGAVHTHDPDVAHSRALLGRLRASRPALGKSRALDVAGGVGRVTRCVLSSFFETVDITDVAPRLLEQAAATIPASTLGDLALATLSRVQVPAGRKYDVIWVQWCLGYVVDVDLVQLLRRFREALNDGGVIIVKETAHSKAAAEAAGELFWVDAEDLNIVRGPKYWSRVFALAGLRLIREEVQAPWPDDYLPVHMWVLD